MGAVGGSAGHLVMHSAFFLRHPPSSFLQMPPQDDWGLAEWGPHIHGLLLSGQATATEAALTMVRGA
jgi:hypothetical protein